MWLSAPGRSPRQQSTKIPHHAPGKEQRAELKRQAEAVYARAQAEFVLDARKIARPTITLAKYLEWYETHLTPAKRGAARERELLAQLVAAFGGTILLADLTRERIIEWRTARRKAVAVATVNREFDVLRHALNQAIPTYLETSPITGPPKLKRLAALATRERGVLSRADEAKLLQALDVRDQAIVVAALDTLMRGGDLLRLEWAHDHGTYLTVLRPKTGTTYRVPVSPRLRLALKRLRHGGRFIFSHRRKASTERLQANSLKQMLEDGCRRAGIKYGLRRGITFHSLRHTGATRMVEAGVDLRTLQELGGWSSMRMLERYVHPTERRKHEAVASVGAGVPLTAGLQEKKLVKSRQQKRKTA